MNLVFSAYGIDRQMKELHEALNSIAFPVKFTHDGKPYEGFVQGILQPIHLYKYSFPEDQLDVVLRTLRPQQQSQKYSNLNKWYSIVRKLLHLKKIPEYKPEGAFYPLVRDRFPDVSLHMIGYSEDLKQANGNENL